MSAIDTILRGILAGMQSTKTYFAGHARVTSSASQIIAAVIAHDAVDGFVLGLADGIPIVGDRPIPAAADQLGPLIDGIVAWNAGGLFIRPAATECDVTDLLGALAFPPTDEPNSLLFRCEQVGLIGRDSVREGENAPGIVDRDWERARQGRLSTVGVLERGMEDLRENAEIDMEEVGGAAHDLLNLISTAPALALSQVSMRGGDRYTFVHTVNVAVYTLAVARLHVKKPETLVSLAQAALLHDVGKVAVPREVLYKQGSYTPAEWDLMRAHPVRGAEILAAIPGVDDLAVMAAFGHHLRHDGSGYPTVGAGMRRHPLVSLLAIADVYEALIAERPYKEPMPPDEAVALIVREAGRQFDSALVGAFVRAIGIFPVGAGVRLSDGREGIVIEIRPEHPGRPLVRVGVSGGEAQVVDLSGDEAKRLGLRVIGTLARAPRMAGFAVPV